MSSTNEEMLKSTCFVTKLNDKNYLFVAKSIFRPNCKIDRFASLDFSNDRSRFIILDSSSGVIKSSINLRLFGYATGRFELVSRRLSTLSDRIQVSSSF